MRILNWQIDVLSTVKAINKSTTKDYHVHITQVEDTPVKAKKAEKEKKNFVSQIPMSRRFTFRITTIDMKLGSFLHYSLYFFLCVIF
ncbi:hypothetical protein RhiirA4_178284 [Rhizophagus irregularis]|uniref:Uncharacterized protein n=1 Tax=Rhizophagus irregularis TaxID=588596 RepID=A0A2I1FWQ0_9GLOM|nr:hypothetical protein RhiirA4_178284 [Rhizophagus irregularis]